MKTVFYLTVFCCLTVAGFSQKKTTNPRWQLSAHGGLTDLKRLPWGVDDLPSRSFQAVLNYNIPLEKKYGIHYLTIGVGYEESTLVIDGIFTKEDNKYAFVPTDRRQNHILMQSLHIPVMLRLAAFDRLSVSAGPYVNYVLKVEDRYKIGAEKFFEDLPIQNKWNMGLKLEQEFVLGKEKRGKMAPHLGFGGQYQLTKNLSGGRSFHPLTVYFKVGVSLW